MKRLLPCLLFLGLPAWAQDFAADPKAFCNHLGRSGLIAQMEWREVQAGSNIYMCKYADRMGSATHARIGTALLDVPSKSLSLTVSVMGVGSNVRLEARDALVPFVRDVFAAQGKAVPAGVLEALASERADEWVVGEQRFAYMGSQWSDSRTVSLKMTVSPGAASLARATAAPSPAVQAAAADVQGRLDQRCTKAIQTSGRPSQPALWKRQSYAMGAYGYVFMYEQPDGEFVCQACDEDANGSDCPVLGVRLSFGPPGGYHADVPAELDRKCLDALQSSLRPRGAHKGVNFDLVRRVQVSPQHTDARWVYALQVDGAEYRCVIRRQDMSYAVDRKAGVEWKSVALGTMP